MFFFLYIYDLFIEFSKQQDRQRVINIQRLKEKEKNNNYGISEKKIA